MKTLGFICVFFLFSTSFVLGQDSNKVFHLDKIPIELNKEWKFKAGDDTAWASSIFNDNDWIPVDPTGELHYLEPVRKAGIGWFRLNLKVDSSLRGEKLALVISNIGASEIWLNGQMLYRFGNVSSDYKKEKTLYFNNEVFSIKLGGQALQTIAVRFSFNKKNLYVKFTDADPVFRIKFKDFNEAFKDRAKEESFYSSSMAIQVSFYLPLGFLLLFLFIYYRRQKEYLYFGIFCFCMFTEILFNLIALSGHYSTSQTTSLLLTTQGILAIGALTFIIGTYKLYQRKRSWFYYVLFLYGLLIIPMFFISYDWGGIIVSCFFPVINIEFLRLNVLSVRKKRPGAWILLVTSILLAFTLIALVWLGISGYNEASAIIKSVSFMIPGLGLSLFFAGEFARTSSSLHLRIKEVEKLSGEMIAREKEKQELLSQQNILLEKQVTERTTELSQSLQHLKETQSQLVQREKMASLGELTAGIAHEIQNPLNFVNNFSEVNTELIDEMQEEINKGNLDEVKAIAKNIKENEQKINHHGKRADSIVKGMLQHSRNSSGQKEPTDINALADECMRLSYHGLRAKNKSFNAKTETDFDSSIPKINIAPQDIGRVVLNLFTNAFYSVMQKKKQLGDAFEPIVTVTTKMVIPPSGGPGGVEIKIRDNGNGVPQKVIDKIFQPFFTTKPVGEGTGLGLSMSYEIITKGHNGELKVETKEGEFAEFIIILPV